MTGTAASSRSKYRSDLVRLFTARVPLAEGDPERAVYLLTQELCKGVKRSQIPLDLNLLLPRRRVKSPVKYLDELKCDGQIRPFGPNYEAGFTIALSRNSRSYRWRFTLAHELFHTFFYELVPEIKFSPHTTDLEEERLCNLGAAELLLPKSEVKKHSKGMPPSLESLRTLAKKFQVSTQAMLLRLKDLSLWTSALTIWRPTSSHSFFLDRIVGGRKCEWEWGDPSIPRLAWDSGRVVRGHTYVQYKEKGGGLKVAGVSFEIERRRETLIALWNLPCSGGQRKMELPLFCSAST